MRLRKMPFLFVVLALVAGLGMATLVPIHPVGAATGAPYVGLTNMGMPTSPQAFYPSSGYDVAVDDRGNTDPNGLLQQVMPIADHGPDCGAPASVPSAASSHVVRTIGDSVYICHDHVMTTLNMDGYGEAVIMPDAAPDWSTGAVTIDWRVSTFSASDRDWWDAWVTPSANQLIYPAHAFYPDLNGEPVNALHVGMVPANGQHAFEAQLYSNGNETDLQSDTWTGQESVLTPSRSIRTRYELVINRTHVRFWLPDYGLVYLDQDVSVPFTQGILQLAHHSYNPQKSDGCGPPADQSAAGQGCQPNTWHWSDIAISNAVHFDISHPSSRFLYPTHAVDAFAAPAVDGSHLRFMVTGSNPQISFDGGATYQAVAMQQSTKPQSGNWCEPHQAYVAIPAGAAGFQLRAGNDCYGRGWFARDFSVVGPLGVGGVPPTPTPSPSPPPSPSPSPTPIPLDNTPCMITENGAMVSGTCTGTFTPSK